MSRDEALPLVQRLLDCDIASEAEGDEILDALHRGLACPHTSDYIYWATDPDLSAERIVDRALAYKPIPLRLKLSSVSWRLTSDLVPHQATFALCDAPSTTTSSGDTDTPPTSASAP